jgi:hypothetical protein
MKRIVSSFAAVLMLTGFSCTTAPDSVVSPVEPEITPDAMNFEEECHENMRVIGGQQAIYFAMNGCYASSMEELGLAGISCPECGLEYLLEGDERTYSIHCPLPSDPTHGSIVDGMATWTPGSSGHESECRACMRTIASQCVLFFAMNSRYPENLEEIGMGNFTCPECGYPYVYSGDEKYFFIECGKPTDPNHGCIDNGVVSW